jgi:hypothetical protein
VFSFISPSRFRQEYRLERKLLAELSIDPDMLPGNKDLSSLISSSAIDQLTAARHFISRVVVLHNDAFETFSDPPCGNDDDFFDNESFWSGSITWY